MLLRIPYKYPSSAIPHKRDEGIPPVIPVSHKGKFMCWAIIHKGFLLPQERNPNDKFLSDP
ncbi:MAG: hypothetical protein A2X03_09680 [Bacteroidetes bacterium GWA2_40_15]|nr:MAG: hypothetical protein A2X03_09680 [Bacteroidetes bacterium GWA2_40_15]HBQ82788.1 hypothetical protein [Bacteroidales bacterium]